MATEFEILTLEAATKAAQTVVRKISAGAIESIDCRGQSFYLISCTAPLVINAPSTSPTPYRQGQGSNFPQFFRFQSLNVENRNAFDVYVIMWVGFGEFIDRNTFVTENPTRLIGSNSSGITAGTTLTLTGVPPAPDILRRKSVMISNLDPANFLEILDSNNNLTAVIFAQTIIEIVTTGIIKIKNTTGSTITFRVGELWYTL